MKNPNHIIEKVLLEVNTSNLETAHSIKNNIDVFLKEELFPRLELLFDEYSVHNEIIRFDELALDIPVNETIDFKGIQAEICKQLHEKIQSQIPAAVEMNADFDDQTYSGGKHVQRISPTTNSGQIFLFFLETGCLPWYGKEEQITGFIQPETWEKSLDDHAFLRKLDHLLETVETAVDRFILQFHGDLIAAYLGRKDFRIKAEIPAILKICGHLNHETRQIFFKLLIRISQGEFTIFPEAFKRLITLVLRTGLLPEEKKQIPVHLQLEELFLHIIPKSTFHDSLLTKTDWNAEEKPDDLNAVHEFRKGKTKANQEISAAKPEGERKPENSATKEICPFLEKTGDEILVQNAGLILLHPFLKPFFAATGITGMQENLVTENFDLAVQSLHFLATGNENVFEGNLVFEKFLCGVPLKMPILKESLLSGFLKSEATDLLDEVVRNWPALKNTSADGLRQMFIQRDGKLIQEEGKYKLIVERKAQDVLLERLNWNIAVIKLPWISHILFTEW